MTEQMKKWMSYYLFLTMLVSSFVSFEPAPYDLLMMIFIALGFLFSFFKMTKETVFPIIVMCMFLVSNLISLFFVKEMGEALAFTGITFYLALTWIALVFFAQQVENLNFKLIMNGYLISASLAALLGTLAYFQLLPFSEKLLVYGRATAFFKDPNVFGPFLVMPALFAISMTEMRNITFSQRILYFAVFTLLAIGILLSFSRAAWGNFALSLAIYLLILKREWLKKRIRTILILLFLGLPMFFYFIQTPMVEELFENRLGYQGYDDTRFNTQKAVFTTGLSNPLGVGGGRSDDLVETSPHSLYARVFTENGVIGVFSLLILLLLSIRKAYKNYWQKENDSSTFHLVIFASLIGLAFNSFFVDTLHWRHFWLLLALAWLPKINLQGKKESD